MAFALGSRAQSNGYRLANFETVGSTNAEALERIRQGERGPLWLVTSEQTAGRGRRQRQWVSARGNLAASVIETVQAPRATAASLGFAAGLALGAALRRVGMEAALRGGAQPFHLKWPNDVIVGGAKLAGILLEADASTGGDVSVVVGMGVNVVSSPTDTPYPATSLAALGIAIDAEGLFTALSDAWTEFFEIWDHGRGLPRIRELWLARAAGIGEPVTVRNGDMVATGRFDTIDDTGCLIVMTQQGERLSIAAGDVHFGAAMTAGAA